MSSSRLLFLAPKGCEVEHDQLDIYLLLFFIFRGVVVMHRDVLYLYYSNVQDCSNEGLHFSHGDWFPFVEMALWFLGHPGVSECQFTQMHTYTSNCEKVFAFVLQLA